MLRSVSCAMHWELLKVTIPLSALGNGSEPCEPVKLLSRVWLFVIPWTIAYQAPPPMEFSSQEYCSGLPFSSSGDLLNLGIKPRSPALQADALLSELPGNLLLSKAPMLTWHVGMGCEQKINFCCVVTKVLELFIIEPSINYPDYESSLKHLLFATISKEFPSDPTTYVSTYKQLGLWTSFSSFPNHRDLCLFCLLLSLNFIEEDSINICWINL